MPGRKTSRASPEREANRAAMPIPTRALTTNCTVERWTSRTRSRATVAVTLMMSDRRRSWETIHDVVKRTVGTALSMMPRRPPSALASCDLTTCSTVSCGVVTGLISRLEFVARVVDDSVARPHPDAPERLEPAAGGDTFDLAAAEPDERDTVRAVVELGFERRHAGDGSKRDRAENAVDRHYRSVRLDGDEPTARLGGVLLELARLLVVRGEPLDRPADESCHASNLLLVG